MLVFESWTARRADIAPLSFLGRGGTRPFALLYGGGEQGRFTIHGEGPIARLTWPYHGYTIFDRRGDLPPFFPDFIGSLSYEWGAALESLVPPALDSAIPIPGFNFVLYERVSIHDRSAGILYEGKRSVGHDVEVESEVEPGTLPSFDASVPFAARFSRGTEDAASYGHKVEAIRERIAAGDVYQVNLSRQEEWDYRGDLRDFARMLYLGNPAPFSAYIAEPGFTVISASPERLVKLDAGWLESRPIKGTAPRGADEVEDRALA